MSVFGEFLRRVRVKSIKLGLVTWDILPSELLINQMNSDPRIEEGLFDPRLSVSKINNLKRSLKQFRDDILRFEREV
jgi:hypothetical protein